MNQLKVACLTYWAAGFLPCPGSRYFLLELCSSLSVCKIHEVKNKQKLRKTRELKTYVQKALWFAEGFGLKLDCAKFNEVSGNKSHTINFRKSSTTEDTKKDYDSLPEAEKEKIKEILFITDKFGVGEAAYHEITMSDRGEGLPRSYLVKQCKNSLDSLCHVSRTPGPEEGAQLDFETELRNALRKQVN